MSKGCSQQPRQSLQAVCSSLRALGVSELTPEVLIHAKSGGPVADTLGRALHDLVILRLAGWPAADPSLLRQYWTQLDSEGGETGLSKQGQQLVTLYLQRSGYRRSASYTARWYCDTRELLLALGWLVADTQALQHALQQNIYSFGFAALLPPYPQDALHSRAATYNSQRSQMVAQHYLQQVKDNCAGNQGWTKVQISCDHALVLLSKCQTKLRSLQSLHQSRHRLCHAIASTQHQTQASKRKRRCALSPYELSLLKSQEKLRQHYNSLQQAAAMVTVCSEAQGHAYTFFQWLADVCHHQGQGETSKPEKGGAHGVQDRASFKLLQSAAASMGLQQLESTAARLQQSLEEMLRQADKPAVSSAEGAPACPALSKLQHSILRQNLPADVESGIAAATAACNTTELPWHGWQPHAQQMVHYHHAQPCTLPSTTQDPAAEAERVTAAVLTVAKLLSKSRARHKHDLQLSIDYLERSSGLHVRTGYLPLLSMMEQNRHVQTI